MYKVLTFVGGGYAANTHLLVDGESREAALFDAAAPAEKIAARLEQGGLTLRYLILTHAHYDHMLTLSALRAAAPAAAVCVGAADAPAFSDAHLCCANIFGVDAVSFPPPDRLLAEGDALPLGGGSITVLSTPGHTPGCCCFAAGELLITGDTLFAGGNGRYDLPGGDYRTLRASLARLAALPGDHKIYPGHGGTSTLSAERERNPYLR